MRTDVARFYDIILDCRKVVSNLNVLTDETIKVNYHYRDQFVENDLSTNIYVAAYTKYSKCQIQIVSNA
jgi:hypothetical protein